MQNYLHLSILSTNYSSFRILRYNIRLILRPNVFPIKYLQYTIEHYIVFVAKKKTTKYIKRLLMDEVLLKTLFMNDCNNNLCESIHEKVLEAICSRLGRLLHTSQAASKYDEDVFL